MKIRDAVVVVTGGNRGLGRALVEAALQAGAARVLAGSRNVTRLDDLVRRSEGRVVPLSLDVTSSSSLEHAARHAADATVLINNAGVLASHNGLSSSTEAI